VEWPLFPDAVYTRVNINKPTGYSIQHFSGFATSCVISLFSLYLSMYVCVCVCVDDFIMIFAVAIAAICSVDIGIRISQSK